MLFWQRVTEKVVKCYWNELSQPFQLNVLMQMDFNVSQCPNLFAENRFWSNYVRHICTHDESCLILKAAPSWGRICQPSTSSRMSQFRKVIIKLTLIPREAWIIVMSLLIWNVMDTFLKWGSHRLLEGAAFKMRHANSHTGKTSNKNQCFFNCTVKFE